MSDPVDHGGHHHSGPPASADPPDTASPQRTTGPPGTAADPRRRIPRTDRLLALPEVTAAAERLSAPTVRDLARAAQDRARRGEILPEEVPAALREALTHRRATALTPVLNATGVVVHTNLGRAPLSAAATEALSAAAGYVDVELDLD